VDVGDVVADKYEVKRVLEVGGRSTLLEAVELEHDRFVVIESFRHFRVPEASERFLRELSLVATLQSEHVARVFASGSLPDGTQYVVSEPPLGESLDTVLRRHGPLPLVRVVELILQACGALYEAHAVQVVHQDLSPETLFSSWNSDGTSSVKVRDFGVRLAIHAITEGRRFGAPRYTAPEQIRQPFVVDPRTDIWALGATMYELSSGHRPFEQPPEEMEGALLTSAPRPLRERRPGLPMAFSDAVMRCLERSPGARYAGVAELAEAISPYGPARGQGMAGAVRGVLAAGATRLKSSTEMVRHLVRQRKP
jgi:serine/threonine-protein kinase